MASAVSAVAKAVIMITTVSADIFLNRPENTDTVKTGHSDVGYHEIKNFCLNRINRLVPFAAVTTS